jgi:hypothetical protein
VSLWTHPLLLIFEERIHKTTLLSIFQGTKGYEEVREVYLVCPASTEDLVAVRKRGCPIFDVGLILSDIYLEMATDLVVYSKSPMFTGRFEGFVRRDLK